MTKTIKKYKIPITFFTLSLLALLITIFTLPQQSKATVGWTEDLLTPPTTAYDGYLNQSTAQTWYPLIVDNVADAAYTNALFSGWTCAQEGYFNAKLGLIGFDLSGVPEDAYYGDNVTITLTVLNGDFQNFGVWYGAIFKHSCVQGSIGTGDYPYWLTLSQCGGNPTTPRGTRLSNIIAVSSLVVGQKLEFVINQSDWMDYLNESRYTTGDGDIVWFTIATMNQGLVSQPTWYENRKAYLAFEDTGYDDPPSLYLSYIEPIPDREQATETNDDEADPDFVTGNETCDSVDWRTLRCAWGGDSIWFDFQGDAGAELSLALLDINDTVIDAKSDSIRVDGHYYWETETPTDFDGYIKATDYNSGVTSIWGYSKPNPIEMQPLYCYSYSSDHPAWDTPFNSFIVNDNDVMFIYWKTNLTDSDLDDYSLELWATSDNTSVSYNGTMQYLIDNYYLNTNSDNDGQVYWEYALFSPNITQTGYETYDGLIQDLDLIYNYSTSGFYTPVIADAAGNSYTISHSDYYYLTNVNQGLSISLDKHAYSAGQTMTSTITVGRDSKIGTDLTYLTVYTIDEDNNIHTTYSSVQTGTNTIEIDAPTNPGDYRIFYTFSNEDNPLYEYTTYLKFSIGKGTLEDGDILGGFQRQLDVWNLDNPGGHWIALIAGMLLLFFAFYASHTLRLVVPLILFAAACATQWIDPLFVILLAILCGVWIWKRVHNNQNEVT